MTTTNKLDDCAQVLTALDARLQSLKSETKSKREEYDQELKRLVMEALNSVPWKISYHSPTSIETDLLPATTALGKLASQIRDRDGQRNIQINIQTNDRVRMRFACSDGNIINCDSANDLLQLIGEHHLTVDTSLLLEKAEEWQKKADDYRYLSLQIIQASIQKKEEP